MNQHIDRIDIEILKIVQNDSTKAIKDIAKEVGLSATPTYERIKRLENDGYIKKYVAVLDGIKLGLDIVVYCNVTLKEQSKKALLEFETAVASLPEVLEVTGLSGNYDYMLKIVSPNIHAYNNFLMNKFSTIPNVGQFHSNIVLGDIKSNSPLPLEHLSKK
jgi:DNA-binding Lrp family transcriptional regulator